jgi:hypothetical protein
MDTTLTTIIKPILPINYFPQAKEFSFEEDNLFFSSKFDSGNLFNAQRNSSFSVI